MELAKSLELIAAALDSDVQNIKAETALETLDEWDSMGKIAIIAMLDKKFEKILSAEQIDGLKTVQDIIDYMK